MSEEELIQFKQWRRYEKEEEEQDRTLFEFGSSTSKDDNDSVKATVGLAALTSIFNSSMKRTASQGIHEINSMENDDEMINPATSIGMAQYLLGAGGVTVVMMVMLMMGYPVWATALTLFAAGAWAVSAIEIADPVPSPA